MHEAEVGLTWKQKKGRGEKGGGKGSKAAGDNKYK